MWDVEKRKMISGIRLLQKISEDFSYLTELW